MQPVTVAAVQASPVFLDRDAKRLAVAVDRIGKVPEN